MTDPAIFGHDLFGEVIKPKSMGPVADKFLFPPMSIIDGRRGEWLDRKRAWKALGINGEVGRGSNLLANESERSCYGKNNHRVDDDGSILSDPSVPLTSVFDPVLCELAYRWWSSPYGQILDPFAGGSVRGIVAGMMGRKYWGCDLRPEQIEANRKQAEDIAPDIMPEWVCGDSLQTVKDAPASDFVFSCPPYGDLEVYSDNPQDLSAMPWPSFLEAYRAIIAGAVARLKPNRFACFVVGDFRDERGLYRNFTGETVRAFEDAGARLYNEAIILAADGSAFMRVSRQFNASRKLCKTHQNVFVFVKGDWRKAADACKVEA